MLLTIIFSFLKGKIYFSEELHLILTVLESFYWLHRSKDMKQARVQGPNAESKFIILQILVV